LQAESFKAEVVKVACNRQMCNKMGFLRLKTLTGQEHRSIPVNVMRYTPLLLLLFVLSAGVEPAYSQSCPTVAVSCPDSINSDSVTFTANVALMPNAKYVWTVSAGRITSGQGTTAITVEVRGTRTVTATIEVIGFPGPCQNTASCTIIGGWIPRARKFDEYRPGCKAKTSRPSKSKRSKLRMSEF
jgi:hypothetical protein